MKTNKKTSKTLQMMLGILLIGIAVGCYRISEFGVDAFSCMNLGISTFLGMSFGNWQLIVNAVLLVAVFFFARKLIGLGTVVNMVFVGYISDFLCWLLLTKAGLSTPLAVRVPFLLVGTVLAALGCALYIEADLGVSPYDSVAIILNKLFPEKLSFRTARVCSDVTVVVVGIAFCIASGHSFLYVAGLGTLINAFFNGPLIQFFQKKLTKG